MAILLNIDTAVETASVCLSKDAEVTRLVINENQKDHAAWLHTVIRNIVQGEGLRISDLNAIAISIGPGSYTGLRIGLAAAKGLCYALKIPLITINTLEMIALAAKKETLPAGKAGAELICPLIDARRMEVFTAVYNKSLHEILQPSAMIITKDSFADLLSLNTITFCGNGSKKLQAILSHSNAIFSDSLATAANIPHLSHKFFEEKRFAELAYTEPFYLKEFYSGIR